jgi:hypothetical protein
MSDIRFSVAAYDFRHAWWAPMQTLTATLQYRDKVIVGPMIEHCCCQGYALRNAKIPLQKRELIPSTADQSEVSCTPFTYWYTGFCRKPYT